MRSVLVRTLWVLIGSAAIALAQGTAKPADELSPGSPQVVQPQDLAKALKSGQKPVILYVGPKTFYSQAHIPGAENLGPAGRREGLEALRARAASLPKNSAVVIYCGCCPWDHCPNIRPAYAELKKAGLTNVRALYLATSFGVDWKDKNLPVTSGE